jgi:hypothetical protein
MARATSLLSARPSATSPAQARPFRHGAPPFRVVADDLIRCQSHCSRSSVFKRTSSPPTGSLSEPAVRNQLFFARLNPALLVGGSMSVGPVARGVAVAIGISLVAVVIVAIVTRLFMMVF